MTLYIVQFYVISNLNLVKIHKNSLWNNQYTLNLQKYTPNTHTTLTQQKSTKSADTIYAQENGTFFRGILRPAETATDRFDVAHSTELIRSAQQIQAIENITFMVVESAEFDAHHIHVRIAPYTHVLVLVVANITCLHICCMLLKLTGSETCT